MKLVYDHKIFWTQRYGGISRYFINLFKNFNHFDIDYKDENGNTMLNYAISFDKKNIETVNGVERTLFRLKLGNSQHKVIYEAIRTGDSVRAESVMREHSNTMLEYIELFEKRHEDLSLTDLISYSNYQLNSDYNLIDRKK